MKLIDEAVAAGARREAAAKLLGLSIRSLQRWEQQGPGGQDQRHGPHTAPRNKLTASERQEILDVVNEPAYRDLSPHQIVPRLLDEQDRYVASESTIYRVLRQEQQLAHRARSRPAATPRPQEHVATRPNQVWSWDITWLPGPVRGTFFYAYMILDVWSRKIVGAQVHDEESADLAAQLFGATCRKQGIDPDGVVLHADNGSPMKGATMLATLRKLGVLPSFSRPHVSDDNPFSEALFRTMKYRPEYPSQPFASLQQACDWVAQFVHWYNTQHRHSAIRYVTPEQRHQGQDVAILQRRARIYDRARQRHPDRWANSTRNWTPVDIVLLNPDTRHNAVKCAA
jgi:transposase InsO family protein